MQLYLESYSKQRSLEGNNFFDTQAGLEFLALHIQPLKCRGCRHAPCLTSLFSSPFWSRHFEAVLLMLLYSLSDCSELK